LLPPLQQQQQAPPAAASSSFSDNAPSWEELTEMARCAAEPPIPADADDHDDDAR
jgi:hypothetical protein